MIDTASGASDDGTIFADGQSDSIWAAFTDVRFRTVTAHRAAPVLYMFVLGGTALFYVFIAVMAFTVSAALGVFWVLLGGPAVCIAAVLVMRSAIELLLSVLIMMEQLEETSEVVIEIAELTTGISAKTEVIPTLPSFVRGVRTRRRAAIQEMRERIAAREAAALSAQDAASDEAYD